MLKIHDGTPDHSVEPMCHSCRLATRIRGHAIGQDATFCGALKNWRVTFVVRSCSQYDDSRIPSRWDMEQIAWELTTSPSRKIGFVSPQERAHRVYETATPR